MSISRITCTVSVIFGDVTDVVKAERVILVAKVQLQIVVTVVVVDWHAHLQYLSLVLLQIGFHVNGVVSRHHVHALHSLLVRLVPTSDLPHERLRTLRGQSGAVLRDPVDVARATSM